MIQMDKPLKPPYKPSLPAIWRRIIRSAVAKLEKNEPLELYERSVVASVLRHCADKMEMP